MAPVPPTKRVEVLDVLRGAALFGILASNMRAFGGPMAAYFDHSLMWTGASDRVAQGFIDLFISGKFITLFSFLFGIGFAIQMDRAERLGASSAFYLRRLGVLLAFGLLHGFLLWSGDILAPYALMGFALFLFRRRSQRTVARWALTLYIWPLIPSLFGAIFAAGGIAIPGPPRPTSADIARTIQVYSTGAYAQIFAEHLKEMFFNVLGLIFFYPRVLGLFLAGMWLWRFGFLSTVESHTAVLRRCQRWGFWIGLAGNATVVAIGEIWHPAPFGVGPLQFAVNLAGAIGIPMMSLFYASTIARAWVESAAWRARLRPCAAVGRTALTNYLAQTVLFTTVFNSWGLGLFGKVNPLAGLGLATVAYGAQMAISGGHLRRFAFGPMEALWRFLTYGRLHEAGRMEARA